LKAHLPEGARTPETPSRLEGNSQCLIDRMGRKANFTQRTPPE
jgi:hypothetical protein